MVAGPDSGREGRGSTSEPDDERVAEGARTAGSRTTPPGAAMHDRIGSDQSVPAPLRDSRLRYAGFAALLPELTDRSTRARRDGDVDCRPAPGRVAPPPCRPTVDLPAPISPTSTMAVTGRPGRPDEPGRKRGRRRPRPPRLREPMFGDEAGEEAGVDRRAMSWRAGIVRSERASSLKPTVLAKPAVSVDQRAEPPDALRAVVEPPGRPEPEGGIVAGERGELAAVGALVQGVDDHGQAGLVAEPVEQRLERPDVVHRLRDVRPLSGPNRAVSDGLWPRHEPAWSWRTRPSSRLIAAISVSIWPRNSSASAGSGDPCRTRANRASASPGGRSAVVAVGWP